MTRPFAVKPFASLELGLHQSEVTPSNAKPASAATPSSQLDRDARGPCPILGPKIVNFFAQRSVMPFRESHFPPPFTSPRTGQAYIRTRPSADAIQRLCREISEQTDRWWAWLGEGEQVARLNRRLEGWASYFCLSQVHIYCWIDDSEFWLERALSACTPPTWTATPMIPTSAGGAILSRVSSRGLRCRGRLEGVLASGVTNMDE